MKPDQAWGYLPLFWGAGGKGWDPPLQPCSLHMLSGCRTPTAPLQDLPGCRCCLATTGGQPPPLGLQKTESRWSDCRNVTSSMPPANGPAGDRGSGPHCTVGQRSRRRPTGACSVLLQQLQRALLPSTWQEEGPQEWHMSCS